MPVAFRERCIVLTEVVALEHEHQSENEPDWLSVDQENRVLEQQVDNSHFF